MIAKLKHVLQSPASSDPENQAFALLLNRMLWLFTLAGLVMAAAGLTLGGLQLILAYAGMGIVLAGLALQVLMRSARLLIAAVALLALLFVSTSYWVYNWGSVRNVNVMMFLIIVLLGQTLLGHRAGWISLAVSGAAVLLLAGAESQGLLPASETPSAGLQALLFVSISWLAVDIIYQGRAARRAEYAQLLNQNQ